MLRRAVLTATRLSVMAILAAASPAFAQIDLSGEWAGTFHEDLPHRGGVRLGDYTGLPLNEAGWRKGQSWDEDARSTPERQCIPHVVTYALRGPATIRFIKVIDPVSGELQAYLLQGSYGRPRTIWMDGREHPSNLAPHTWGGFSTGAWERNTLVVFTTHIKTGWLLRNGAPTSDLATMEEHFTRYDDYLVVATIVNDPVYLDEPFIRTTNFVLSLTTDANAWGNCGPAQITDELGGRPKGAVPHYLPGVTAHIQEFVTKSGVPAEAARGGAATTYPEYMARLKSGNLDNRLFPDPVPGKSLPRVVSPQTNAPDDVVVLPVQEDVYLLAGAGGNMAVQVGPDGVLLVDAGAGVSRSLREEMTAAMRRRLKIAFLILVAVAHAAAQAPPAPKAPKTPREAAPIDLTGNWVSVVTEDWRWRMLTPAKGDYASVPLNPEGKKVADRWDPAKAASDGCKPYGAAGVMREPGRLRIAWEDDTTLRIETDAGLQTRRLHFDRSSKPQAEHTWQGHSFAEWEPILQRGGLGVSLQQAPPKVGALKVVTANLRAGYLRTNGVPYSENTAVTEYFDRFSAYGTDWLMVLTIVEDPRYLDQPFITSTHFKREPDGSKWIPKPCETGSGQSN